MQKAKSTDYTVVTSTVEAARAKETTPHTDSNGKEVPFLWVLFSLATETLDARVSCLISIIKSECHNDNENGSLRAQLKLIPLVVDLSSGLL